MADNIGSIEKRIDRMAPVSAPPEQQNDVKTLVHLLEREKAGSPLQLVTADGESAFIPESVLWILAQVAQVMASGDAVSIVPVSQELTVQQAADLLNVPLPYLVRLLEEGHVPFRRTETGRGIRVADVITYKRQRDQERSDLLDELADLSQQYGGYHELKKG